MRILEIEVGKLEGWAADTRLGLEREIEELDCQVKEARRAATLGLTLEEELAGQKRIKALESQRALKRRSLFEAQNEVNSRRDDLIAVVEDKLTQCTTLKLLFAIRWQLV